MQTLDVSMQQLLLRLYPETHPNLPQTLMLLRSLRELTQSKAGRPLSQIDNVSVYFYSFLRTALLSEKDKRKIFSASVLLLALLKESSRRGDQRVVSILQSDDDMEKRAAQIVASRKERRADGGAMEVEGSLLYLAVMKTKSKESWQMWVNAKPRMAILLKLATDSKKKVRKNGLAFLKRLLKDTNSNISHNLWSKGIGQFKILDYGFCGELNRCRLRGIYY